MGEKKLLCRGTALLLSTALIVSMFVGCSKGKVEEISATKAPAKVSDTLELPIVKEPLTLTYYTTLRKATASLKDFNEMELFKEREKLTGIHIEFRIPPSAQAKDQFNLMLASNDLPDMIWSGYFKSDADAVLQAFITPLNDLMKYTPNYKKVLDLYPNVKKSVTTDNGDIAGFAFVQPDIEDSGIGGFVIRKDWLEKLNLKVPETIDEWETVLTAFKTKDPNGNGKADEVPFASQRQSNLGNFCASWGITKEFYMEGGTNGKVAFGPTTPQFKGYITKMNDWFKKGLLDPNYVTNDAKLHTANIIDNRAGATYGGMFGDLGNWVGLTKNDPNFLMWPAPYPKLKSDSKVFVAKERAISQMFSEGYISNSSKHKVEAAKWFDFGYSEKGQLMYNFGKEGLSYKMVDGVPTYTDEVWKNPNGLASADAIGKYAFANSEEAFVAHQGAVSQMIGASPAQRQALKVWKQGWMQGAENNIQVPSGISLLDNELTADARRYSDFRTYLDEKIDKFITGVEPMSNYDAFVTQLKAMGVDESVKVRQAAVERWRKRGGINYEFKANDFKANYKNVPMVTEKGKQFLDADLK